MWKRIRATFATHTKVCADRGGFPGTTKADVSTLSNCETWRAVIHQCELSEAQPEVDRMNF
eukprot:3032088-Rhodomonas_salina.3